MDHRDVSPTPDSGTHPAAVGTPAVAPDFELLIRGLNAGMETAIASGDSAACLELITALESAKASLCAIQARAAHAVEEQTIARHRQSGTRQRQLHRGAASMVALARRKPQRGSRIYLDAARVLECEMPYLASRFAAGQLGEDQVLAIIGALLEGTSADRAALDRRYSAHPELFEGMSTVQCTDVARRQVDARHGRHQANRLRRAERGRFLRCVRQDQWVRVYGRLPLPEGLALKDRLERGAYAARHAGDPRTGEQVMCDLLLGALSGSGDGPVPLTLQLQLVMTERSLFLGDDEPALLPGYGVVPAAYARRLLASPFQPAGAGPVDPAAAGPQRRVTAWLRRLFTAPGGKDLVAMDSRRRLFPEGLKGLIAERDVYCRTPYCTNRASQADHVVQAVRGGPTSLENGVWRCASCNLAKETRGWREVLEETMPHTIGIEPVPGIRYRSTAPPVVGIARQAGVLLDPQASWLQQVLAGLDDPG